MEVLMNFKEYEELVEKAKMGQTSFQKYYDDLKEQYTNNEISLEELLEAGIVEHEARKLLPKPSNATEHMMQSAMQAAVDEEILEKQLNIGFYFELFDNKTISFQQLIDFAKEHDVLAMFFDNSKVENAFEYFHLGKKTMTVDDLKYLCEHITTVPELDMFFKQHPFLVKSGLENDCFDKKTLDQYNEMMPFLLW